MGAETTGPVPMTVKGAVACGHPITAAAAEEILREGGNAFDAVIAAFFAACVAEPVLASLGGGGYLMAQRAESEPVAYDFFVHTPRRKDAAAAVNFYPIHADFGTATQEFHVGLGAVATPGGVRGAFAIHRDLGSLPMSRLVEPAVRAARAGFTLEALQAFIFNVVRPIFLATPQARAVYASRLDPTRLTQGGEMLVQSEMGDTIEALAREGEGLFYEGEIACRIAELCQAGGGFLTVEDLRYYRVERRQSLGLDYRGARLYTNPPPSSGGILIAFGLALLRSCPLDRLGFGSAEALDLLAQIMALTNKARLDCLAAGGQGDDHARLLDDGYLGAYQRHILHRPGCMRGTTHISIIDAAGNVAALTASNGEGCGHLIPGTGIMLNNMLGEEDLNPGGFHRWPAGARMTSMMAPSLLHLPGGKCLALGSGGSNRIRTALLQVISNLVDFNMTPEAAVAAPRIHYERGRLNVEPGYAQQELDALLQHYPDHELWREHNLYFGGVHTVELEQGRFHGVGDPRRGGVGAVVE
jgi:gamma-glutamyltranspeptidase/glutathione hydrolase